MSFDHQRVV